MIKINIEKCFLHISNKYDLVLIASKRARFLSKNSKSLFIKPTVLALNEIEKGYQTTTKKRI